MIRNRLAIAGLAAGLVGGGVAGAVLGVPALAGAQEEATTTTTVADPTTTTAADEVTTTTAAAEDEVTTTTAAGDDTTTTTAKPEDGAKGGHGKGDRSQHLKDALAPLVADGTITQAQADKIIAALQAAQPKGGEGRGGHGGHGFGFGFGRGFDLDAAASALGIDLDALRTSLKEGQSIKEIAAAQGVDVQQVIDSLTAQLKTKLDEQVAAGRITQDEANERLVKSVDALTRFVNGELPKFGGRDAVPAPDAPPAPEAPDAN